MSEPNENVTTDESVQDTAEQGIGDYLDNYRENDYPEDPSDWRDIDG